MLARKLFRSAVFLASYLAACAVATIIVAQPSDMSDSLLPLYLMTLVLLPLGLFLLLDGLAGYFGWLGLLIGWLVYLAVAIPAVVTKKRRVFVALYIIFIILLALSVRGCTSVDWSG